MTNWLCKQKHRKHSMYMEFEVLTARSLYSFGTVQSGWLSQSRKLKLTQEIETLPTWHEAVDMSVRPQIPNHGLDLRGSTMLNREILEISPVCPHCHSHPFRLLRLLGSGQWHEKLKVPFLSCFLRFCICSFKTFRSFIGIQMFDFVRRYRLTNSDASMLGYSVWSNRDVG